MLVPGSSLINRQKKPISFLNRFNQLFKQKPKGELFVKVHVCFLSSAIPKEISLSNKFDIFKSQHEIITNLGAAKSTGRLVVKQSLILPFLHCIFCRKGDI